MDYINTLKDIIEDLHAKENTENIWKDSIFEKINDLKINNSGKVGERLISQICERLNIEYIYDEDIISPDGSYDMIINNKKVEIKTARVGAKKLKFQHETLREEENGADVFLFVDIMPNSFYLTYIKYKDFDFRKKHKILNATPHNRKGTDNIFKFDFSVKRIIYGIENNAGISIDMKTSSSEEVLCFFNKMSE